MKLSVVIPVHNGGDGLRRCLEALAASTCRPDETIVVDDASTDGSAEVARACGARVVSLPGGPRGPAAARNRGAAVAGGDILVFLDADVLAHPDTLARLAGHLATHPDVAAVFGSYDACPAAPGLASRYRNLLHHYVHQHARREASTFWAGCGAIRRDVFLAAGGFSERYARPSIEDIELGQRLRRAGRRIALCPEAQVTHLKRWTLAGLVRTDILSRALPWTRLIVNNGSLPDDLNVSRASRLSAAAAWAMLLFLVASVWRPPLLTGALAAGAALVWLNRDLYRFFARQGGAAFAAGAAALHALYLFYSSLTFAAVAVPDRLGRYGLAILLLATLFKGLVWSVAMPPWHGNDEPDHFLYAQHIERFGSWYASPGNWMPEEVYLALQLAQLKEVQNKPRTFDLSDRAAIAAGKAQLSDPAVKRDYAQDAKRSSGPDLTRFQPPLHYVLLAALQAPLERTSILVRLLASRWLSVALGLATVALAYAAGRTLWPQRPGWALLLATLVSFQPMFTYVMAIANNQALEITLFSGLIVVSLRVLQDGMTWPRAAALGVLTGLGLLTKISFIAALPLLGLLIVWEGVRLWRRAALGRQALGAWASIVATPVVLGGWWYWKALASGGTAWESRFGRVSGKPAIDLATYLWQRNLPGLCDAIMRGSWANFGHLDSPFPSDVTTLAVGLSVIGTCGAAWWLIRQIAGRRPLQREAWALIFLGCATASLFAFYVYLDYRMARDLGGYFGIQSRYFLPALIGQMAVLIVGLGQFVPRAWRRAWLWLLGMAAVAASLLGLLGVLAPRYYGASGLRTLAIRATILWPVSASALLAGEVVFLALTVVLAIALWGALAAPPQSAPAPNPALPS